jgi:hypothetical protein
MSVDIDREKGLYGKYRVERIGGTPGKHDDCWYYVLDWEHDKYSRPALRAYADACRDEYPDLARDLDSILPTPMIAVGLDVELLWSAVDSTGVLLNRNTFDRIVAEYARLAAVEDSSE